MTEVFCSAAHLTSYSSLPNPSPEAQALFEKYQANIGGGSVNPLAAHICHREGVRTLALSVFRSDIEESISHASDQQGNQRVRKMLFCLDHQNKRCKGFIPTR